MISKKALIKKSYQCHWCERKFRTYNNLSKHTNLCVMKARLEGKDSGVSKMAHMLWRESFRNTYRKKLDFNDFANHRDYFFFMNLAVFCLGIQVIEPVKFMDWCIREKIKMKAWTSELVYERYIKSFLIHENPIEGVIRSINYIKGLKIKNFFKTIEVGKFLNMMEMGRLSPWLTLLSNEFKGVSSRMNEDQKRFYGNIVNQSAWSMNVRKNQKICEKIKDLLKLETL